MSLKYCPVHDSKHETAECPICHAEEIIRDRACQKKEDGLNRLIDDLEKMERETQKDHSRCNDAFLQMATGLAWLIG